MNNFKLSAVFLFVAFASAYAESTLYFISPDNVKEPLGLGNAPVVVGPVITHENLKSIHDISFDEAEVFVSSGEEAHVGLKDLDVHQWNALFTDVIEIIHNMAKNHVFINHIDLTNIYFLREYSTIAYRGPLGKMGKKPKPKIAKLLSETVEKCFALIKENADENIVNGITEHVGQFKSVLKEMKNASGRIDFKKLADIFIAPDDAAAAPEENPEDNAVHEAQEDNENANEQSNPEQPAEEQAAQTAEPTESEAVNA